MSERSGKSAEQSGQLEQQKLHKCSRTTERGRSVATQGNFNAVGAPKVALEIYQVWRDEAWTGCRAAAAAPRTVSQSPSLCITCSVTNVQKHVSSKKAKEKERSSRRRHRLWGRLRAAFSGAGAIR